MSLPGTNQTQKDSSLAVAVSKLFFLIFRCFLKYLTLNYPGLNVTNTDLPSPAELLLLVLFSDLSLLHVTPVFARSHSTRYMPGSFAAHRPPAPLQAVPGLLWDLRISADGRVYFRSHTLQIAATLCIPPNAACAGFSLNGGVSSSKAARTMRDGSVERTAFAQAAREVG